MQSSLPLPERLGNAGILRAITDVASAAIVVAIPAFALDDLAGPAIALGVTLVAAFGLGRYARSCAASSIDETYATLAVALLCGGAGVACAFAMGRGSAATFFAPAVWAVIAAPLAVYGTSSRRGRCLVDATCERVDDRARSGSRPTDALIRALDLLFASVGFVLFLPIMAAVAIAVFADSGAPVFFRQERVGLGGRAFTMFKFRTMRPDADGAWARPGDARITATGAFLRRTSLDELPQLINVLRGEMSLVGPRPEMREYAERFATERSQYPQRHYVRPGITGWAQLHLPRNLQPSDMPAVLGYDLFYVQNRDAILYVSCLVKTAIEVLAHRAV